MEDAKKPSVYLVGAVAAVVLGAATAWLIHDTTGVHIPLLAAAVAGIILGLIDPRRGWIAALIQSVVLIVGVLVAGRSAPVPEIEYHSLIGSVGLTFAGSFIGAFIKRAFDN